MLSSNNPINPHRMNSHPKTMGGPTPTIQSPYLAMFDNFRNELDEHHDRRERIIKASRDITALSKKMQAFLLSLPPSIIIFKFRPTADHDFFC